MNSHTIITITVIVYIIIMIGVSLYARTRISNSEDYHLAGRRLGTVMLAGTLAATEIGGGSTIGVTAKAYGVWGISAAWYVIATGIGIFLVAFIAPYMRKTMATTVPEIIGRRYGKISHLITSLLSVISLISLAAAQITACATVVSVMLNINFSVALLIAGGLLVFYTWVGGMWSLSLTDFIQFFIIVFGFSIAVIYILTNDPHGWTHIFHVLPKEKLSTTHLGWGAITGLIVMYFMTFCTGQEAVQRFYSARNEKIAIRGALLCGVVIAAYAFVPAIFGLIAWVYYPDIAANDALATVAAGKLPPLFAGVVLSAVFFATMSSGSGDLLGASSIMVKDIYYGFINKLPHTSESELKNSKRIVIIVGIIGIVIAFFSQKIIELLIFAFTIRATGPFAAYLFGLLADYVTPRAGLVSIITGTVSGIIWQIIGQPFGIYSIITGALMSLISFLIILKIDRFKGVAGSPSLYKD
ncbi:sodium:solute symporter family protein [Escherichia albertii]|nr:sodium:solute symporter family protein [Escherichia albertii]EFO1265972.1 sodium:solute symporter family protein [Escherichia albertii]